MKNKKHFFISCNCKTNYAIYPFLLPLLFMFIRYFHDKIVEESEPSFSYKILKYNLPFLFYLYLPKVLSIILLPIINYNTKSENNESFLSLRKYHIFKKNKKKKKLLLLFYVISLFEVIQETGDFLLYYFQRAGGQLGWLIEKKTGYIIFVPIFSIFILDKVLHRHHILALILGLIGAFIINYIRFYLEFARKDDYNFHLLNILFSALSSFAIVVTKYTLNNFIIKSPYVFLFYDGIFCIINSFICMLIEWKIIVNIPDNYARLEGENDHFFKNNYLEIFTLFQNQNRYFFIYFFLSFFLSFFYYIIYALTIYNFSPYLIIVLEALLPIDNDIIPYFLGKEVYREEDAFKRTYIQLIGYAIIFFAALILDEMLILNFCGFNKNTFSKISVRAELDTLRELSMCSEMDEDEKINEEEGKGEINA